MEVSYSAFAAIAFTGRFLRLSVLVAFETGDEVSVPKSRPRCNTGFDLDSNAARDAVRSARHQAVVDCCPSTTAFSAYRP